EPDNKVDSFAVKIFANTGEHLGYIPRYYSKSVSEAMERGVKFICTVKEFNKENNCNECIKIHMKGIRKI
ncbi:MAG TPA: HIRAN domain-containing protein, partial [Anaerovoracaceae bacterium]|nr:HIRAN domain-containing protein [Anaerovoracaceae bacterium]